jgi:putative transposase
MNLHRNSQRRIYIPDAAYFITVKTLRNEPYFREPIFCDLFVENLKVSKRLKGFELYGWVLCYDHFHLVIRPTGKWNYSEIVFSIKKQFSHDANRVMGINPPFPNEGAQTFARLRGVDVIGHQTNVERFRDMFTKKYADGKPFPKFQWQKSFHDHYCRGESDLRNHLEYIAYNPTKHGLLSNWPYVFTNPKYADLVDGI